MTNSKSFNSAEIYSYFELISMITKQYDWQSVNFEVVSDDLRGTGCHDNYGK